MMRRHLLHCSFLKPAAKIYMFVVPYLEDLKCDSSKISTLFLNQVNAK